MMSYHLTYRPLSSDVLVDRTFEARSIDEAYTLAGELIADAHRMAGAYVAFERSSGTVTVGAGYRSRRGTYALRPTSVSAGEVSTANEVRSLME